MLKAEDNPIFNNLKKYFFSFNKKLYSNETTWIDGDNVFTILPPPKFDKDNLLGCINTYTMKVNPSKVLCTDYNRLLAPKELEDLYSSICSYLRLTFLFSPNRDLLSIIQTKYLLSDEYFLCVLTLIFHAFLFTINAYYINP